MTTGTVPHLDSNDFASPEAVRAKVGVAAGCVRVTLPDGMLSWLTVGHAAMDEALSHRDLVRGADAADESLRRYLTLAGDFPLAHHILFADDDDHRRMKSVLKDAFTRKNVEKLRPWMTDVVDSLIDEFIEAGSTDYVQSVALPLPIAVISEILGVDEEDRPEFERRASAITGVGNDADQSKIVEAGHWFYEFSGELLAARRAQPRDDVMTTMADAVDAGKLTENEARSNTFLFLSAGYETTVNLLANGLLSLLEHPEALTAAIAAGGRKETQAMVEELLRFDSPVSAITYRFARKPITIAGATIAAGDHVAIALPTANHDTSVIGCPATLDIARTPNPHLSFGKATHFCLGAPLARLEGEVALRRTLDRLQDLRLACPGSQLQWLNSITVHRLLSLPVIFTPGVRASERRV
jgi:cytochrome P450